MEGNYYRKMLMDWYIEHYMDMYGELSEDEIESRIEDAHDNIQLNMSDAQCKRKYLSLTKSRPTPTASDAEKSPQILECPSCHATGRAEYFQRR